MFTNKMKQNTGLCFPKVGSLEYLSYKMFHEEGSLISRLGKLAVCVPPRFMKHINCVRL